MYQHNKTSEIINLHMAQIDGRKIAQWVKGLLGNEEDLSSIPNSHVKAELGGTSFVTPILRGRRRDPWPAS